MLTHAILSKEGGKVNPFSLELRADMKKEKRGNNEPGALSACPHVHPPPLLHYRRISVRCIINLGTCPVLKEDMGKRSGHS